MLKFDLSMKLQSEAVTIILFTHEVPQAKK